MMFTTFIYNKNLFYVWTPKLNTSKFSVYSDQKKYLMYLTKDTKFYSINSNTPENDSRNIFPYQQSYQ